MKNSLLFTLRRVLAELYPDIASTNIFMAEAALDASWVPAEASPRNRWHSILSEAEKNNKIAQALAVATADYPNNAELSQLHRDLKLTEPVSSSLVVLAVWPQVEGLSALDEGGEIEAALTAVGINYMAIRGVHANRDVLVREWERLHPDVLQLDTHGSSGALYLADGLTDAGWWGALMAIHTPSLVLLLACDSSQQDRFDVPDALLRAGVGAVLAVTNEIEDADAIRFAVNFYVNFTVPMPLQTAVERARLTLPDEAAGLIRLRRLTEFTPT